MLQDYCINQRYPARSSVGATPTKGITLMSEPTATPEPAEQPVVLHTVTDRVATITLNRPGSRNALSSSLQALLTTELNIAEQAADTDVIILTGSDPAFCAGLDLKELGSPTGQLVQPRDQGALSPAITPRGPFPTINKPLIGAINGIAITGGLELALNCDFLIASENAAFADTHARVGVMPGWGLTVLLPQAIGVRRAREMSFTGNFMGAEEALHFGLLNRVVPHDQLLQVCNSLAQDIVGNNQDGVRNIRGTYAEIHADTESWSTESRRGADWLRTNFDRESTAGRVAGIQKRGRSQS